VDAASSSLFTLPPTAPKVRLTIVSGSGAGMSLELTRPVTFVGRRDGCKVALNHPKVFAVHAAVVHTGEDVYLRDLTGKETTFHNDLKAICERLAHGDTIRIASWELRVSITGPGSPASPDEVPIIVERLDTGRTHRLSRAVAVIGRRNSSDIVVPDREVSRSHAVIFGYLDGLAICDALSKNGLKVNDKFQRFGRLTPNDIVSIGPHRFKVRRGATSPAGSGSPIVREAPAEAIDDDDIMEMLMDSKADRIDIRSDKP